MLLKRGMDDLGEIHLSNWTHIFNAFVNPWVVVGILCLAGFFYAYLTALSWADLSFVLPATAPAYLLTSALSKVFLHETVSPGRWAGTLLIVAGTSLVARTYTPPRSGGEDGPGGPAVARSPVPPNASLSAGGRL